MDTDREKEKGRFSILLVDEDGENIDAFRSHFRGKHPLIIAGSAAEAKTILSSREVAIALVEQSLKGKSGLELLEDAARLRPGIVGILMSKSADADFLTEVLNKGCVWRFISKPWDADDMKTVLDMAFERYGNAMREKQFVETLRGIASYYNGEISESRGFDIVVGEDGDMAAVMDRIKSAAGASTPVLFRGEKGTGRELLARTMHRLSDRSNAPFIRLDAAFLPKNAVETELFGKDVESGAEPTKKNRVEFAESGTLFIENIEALPPGAQFKLADLLKTGEIAMSGGTHRPVNVRMVCATSARIESLAAARSFRTDLFEMLNALVINVPPLRARRRDIPKLAEFFANRAARALGLPSIKIEGAAMDKAMSFDWPGNLPELKDVIELAAMHCRDGVIHLHDMPGMLNAPIQPAEKTKHGLDKHKEVKGQATGLKNRLEDIERDEIMEALKKTGGKKAPTARLLGVNRSTLYYRMKKHGITTESPTSKGD